MGLQPTFKNSVREEVLDISLTSGSVTSKIRFWRVLEEISMSNHRHITFELTDVKQEDKLWRNPRKTDLVGYEELKEKVKQLPVRLSTGCEIGTCSDSLRECTVRSYENNCSLSSKAEGYGKSRWSLKLSALRKDFRRLYTTSHTDRRPRPIEKLLRMPKRNIKKELERAWSRSWQKYCSEVASLSDTAKLCRVLRNGTPR